MFFTYRQNNSGGRWIGPQMISVEAETAEAAELTAGAHGVYFDGVDAGTDCHCCGDRWYNAPERASVPTFCGVVFPSRDSFSRNDQWVVYHADGSVQSSPSKGVIAAAPVKP
jgi:hypothetical protein